VIDLDATLVTAHSDKEGARGNFKGGFGYHPLGAWLDNTGEARAAVLRPGNAGSNTAADHLTVLDWALSQLPDRWRSKPILIRADGAGYSHALIAALSEQRLEFSVGYPVTDAVRDAIAQVPKWAWQVASNADGDLREHADVVEVTGLLDLSTWTKHWCRTCGSAANCRTPGRRWTRSRSATATATRRSPPTPPAGSWPSSKAPRARPGRRPDPDRQGHRPRAPAVPAPENQRSLDRARADRPRRCATGCCAPQPGSPADSAKCSCAWPNTGPGHWPSPKPSPACGKSRSRPDSQRHRNLAPAHQDHGDTGPAPAPAAAPTQVQPFQERPTPSDTSTERPGLTERVSGGLPGTQRWRRRHSGSNYRRAGCVAVVPGRRRGRPRRSRGADIQSGTRVSPWS